MDASFWHARLMRPGDPVFSLFSGVGGIEEGLAQAGLPNLVGMCDSWPAAQAVLERHHPDVPLRADVRALHHFEGASLVTAGFPCTDLSQAGRTAGLDGLASTLVRDVLDLLPVAKPEWILIENVPNMLALGCGRAMAEITTSLTASGYRWAYRVIDTRSSGLPQRRRRVYLLAARTSHPAAVLFRTDHPSLRPDGGVVGARRDAFGFYWTEGNRGLGWAVDALPTLKGSTTVSIPSPPAAWLPTAPLGARIVTPTIESAERLQGLEPGWTSAAPTRDRWKLVGNAVSVPIARWIGEGLLSEPPSCADGLDQRPLADNDRWPLAAYSDGSKTWSVAISEWPTAPAGSGRHLATILRRHGSVPLSHRASRGFRDRLRASKLRYSASFMRDLDEHVTLTR